MRINCRTMCAGRSGLLLWPLLGLLEGCQQPPAVLSNVLLVPEEEPQKLLMSKADRAEVLAAMRSVAQGCRPVNPPAPAPGGMRWSDVAAAVPAACGDIEAAVVQTVKEQRGSCYRFRLRTIEDWPGELVVHRVEGPAVYVADAWIGRFPQEPNHIERKNKLLAALTKYMKAFGRRRGFNDQEG